MKTLGLIALALVFGIMLGHLVAGCGAENPDVLIQAYYPLNESHQFIVDYLKDFERQYPGRVKLEVYDMQSAEGREKWTQTGLSCAGVFVNGSTQHTIQGSNGPETVNFLQRLDVFWTREDFETVLGSFLDEKVTGPREAEALADPEDGDGSGESAEGEPQIQ